MLGLLVATPIVTARSDQALAGRVFLDPPKNLPPDPRITVCAHRTRLLCTTSKEYCARLNGKISPVFRTLHHREPTRRPSIQLKNAAQPGTRACHLHRPVQRPSRAPLAQGHRGGWPPGPGEPQRTHWRFVRVGDRTSPQGFRPEEGDGGAFRRPQSKRTRICQSQTVDVRTRPAARTQAGRRRRAYNSSGNPFNSAMENTGPSTQTYLGPTLHRPQIPIPHFMRFSRVV